MMTATWYRGHGLKVVASSDDISASAERGMGGTDLPWEVEAPDGKKTEYSSWNEALGALVLSADALGLPSDEEIQECRICGKLEILSWGSHNKRLQENRLCFGCDHFLMEVALTDPRIDGCAYTFGPESSNGMRGFGGRLFRLRFHDGQVVTTTNLWHRGNIPAHLRTMLPDNAEFI